MCTLKNYKPRHIRLGSIVDIPKIIDYCEVRKEVPVIDGNEIVCTESILKLVPSSEVMSKYRASAFRLSVLLDSGVPLDVVNINQSSGATIDRLYDICQTMDGAERYVQKIMEQRAEKESWFKAFDEEKNDHANDQSSELNEIY